MNLGNFSVSLAVKDLALSQEFYAKLGFVQVGGEPAQNWVILQNGTTSIGLFQGMFEKNLLTFNPGWASDGNHPEEFTDVRDLQKHLMAQGVSFTSKTDESTVGPGSFTLEDPDGNTVLVDQHRSSCSSSTEI